MCFLLVHVLSSPCFMSVLLNMVDADLRRHLDSGLSNRFSEFSKVFWCDAVFFGFCYKTHFVKSPFGEQEASGA